MRPLEPYLVTIPKSERAGKHGHKRTTRCPVCETLGSLRTTNGMILCNQCFWAMELKQQAS